MRMIKWLERQRDQLGYIYNEEEEEEEALEINWQFNFYNSFKSNKNRQNYCRILRILWNIRIWDCHHLDVESTVMQKWRNGELE